MRLSLEKEKLNSQVFHNIPTKSAVLTCCARDLEEGCHKVFRELLLLLLGRSLYRGNFPDFRCPLSLSLTQALRPVVMRAGLGQAEGEQISAADLSCCRLMTSSS